MPLLDRFALTGKTVLITGGAGLYGSHFARSLAEAGAHVVTTSRDGDRAAATADRLTRDGLEATGLALDLADAADVERFTTALGDAVGPVDVLVNNAVHRAGGALEDTTVANWEATSAVNSRGLFQLTRDVAAGMAERGRGSIVNIGSIYGLVAPEFAIYEGTGLTMPAFYAYDKAGMVGFTRYLAAWLGPRGVRANCLCPGGLLDGQDPGFVAAYEARVPLGRLAGPDDVTGALVFLASDASAYVTGATLPVDGGWTAK
ncbi:SDR family oxidoreductase [Agromyces silvae]|uniref:SDR family oxidoreductase n=1 Tax=Agromyces silvae TaxID=3388266 RepID=UPI00280AF9C6|nr:SDR family oxidoreductase [Agromyces protaetiae]